MASVPLHPTSEGRASPRQDSDPVRNDQACPSRSSSSLFSVSWCDYTSSTASSCGTKVWGPETQRLVQPPEVAWETTKTCHIPQFPEEKNETNEKITCNLCHDRAICKNITINDEIGSYLFSGWEGQPPSLCPCDL